MNDDIIKGSAEHLRGSLQKRYGCSKDQAQRECDEFVRNTGERGDNLHGREAAD